MLSSVAQTSSAFRPTVSASARRGQTVKVAASFDGQECRRRNMALLLAIPALLTVRPAFAEDVQAAKGAAADRRAEFKETAQKIKQTGKDLSVFPESGFASNEATTRGGKSEGDQKPRQEDSIQPSPFSSPK